METSKDSRTRLNEQIDSNLVSECASTYTVFIENTVKNEINTRRNKSTIAILVVVNLVNFMDRFTIAGVLREVQDYFKIDDSSTGLLQTVFICSYMLLAPLFGYLGDRYPRKWIIIFGVSFWSLMTFIGSFIPNDVTI